MQCSRLQRRVKRNGDHVSRWSRMAQANVASFLADLFVAKTLKRPD